MNIMHPINGFQLKFSKLGKIKFLLVLLLFAGMNTYAQETKLLDGKIISANPDVEKIHVINITKEKGSVTNNVGDFSIIASEKDSIYVSSVQFENKFVVVTEEMIQGGKISIELIDKMNELAEVVIDDIQLSGYLANDLNLISVEDVQTKNRLQKNLTDFIKKDREVNPYYQPSIVEGIRIDKIASAVIDKLSKPATPVRIYTPKELANKSIGIVGYEFFEESLKLDRNEVCNFLYYCTEDVQFKRLVINNNAFVLIEYFESKIDAFKNLRGENLNASHQIPG